MLLDLPPAARQVAVEVLVHGPQSRSQLAGKLGLSAPTVTRLVKPLLAAGILIETGPARSPGRGRSSVLLDVVPDAYRFIGVKLTTESIYAVTTDLRAQVLDSETVAEPSLDVDDVVAAVADLVHRLHDRVGREVNAVGVTVGGVVDDGETVVDSPFLDWHGVPFRSLLAEKLEFPVFLANDVVGLTRAQQWFGHGRGLPSFALLTVGAGVGYGLVVNEQLVPTTVSPVSHLPVDPSGPLCPRGHRGCMTAYVTSGAMVATASQAYRRPVDYEELLDLAEAADPVAVRVVDEAARALGQTVAVVTALTGVDQIILSGEGVRLAEIGRRALRAGRLEYALSRSGGTDPVIRPMGFREWARGAAVVAMQAVFPAPLDLILDN